MIKILANDGLGDTGRMLLESAEPNDDDETPLEVAQRRDQHEIVKLLKTFKIRKQNVFARNFAKHRSKTSAPN